MTRGRHAPIVHDAAINRLLAQSNAGRWGLPRDVFADAVHRAVEKRFGDAAPEESAVEAFVFSLHAEDLALACACAQGVAPAWDHFVLTYRPELYRAARAIGDETVGRELADSLYADLFGLSEKDGERRSLFRYYHGRAKLSTWLRSVLAQRHVDHLRAGRRTTSLDDPERPIEARLPAPPSVDPTRAASMRVAADAIAEALATLPAPERLRLAYYYVHDLTLAQAGRLFGESEATASRKLERARRTLRTGIEAALARRGLAAPDVDDWAAVAREAWEGALADALGVPAPQAAAVASFKGKRTP